MVRWRGGFQAIVGLHAATNAEVSLSLPLLSERYSRNTVTNGRIAGPVCGLHADPTFFVIFSRFFSLFFPSFFLFLVFFSFLFLVFSRFFSFCFFVFVSRFSRFLFRVARDCFFCK